jgi:hypothetical protein
MWGGGAHKVFGVFFCSRVPRRGRGTHSEGKPRSNRLRLARRAEESASQGAAILKLALISSRMPDDLVAQRRGLQGKAGSGAARAEGLARSPGGISGGSMWAAPSQILTLTGFPCRCITPAPLVTPWAEAQLRVQDGLPRAGIEFPLCPCSPATHRDGVRADLADVLASSRGVDRLWTRSIGHGCRRGSGPCSQPC